VTLAWLDLVKVLWPSPILCTGVVAIAQTSRGRQCPHPKLVRVGQSSPWLVRVGWQPLSALSPIFVFFLKQRKGKKEKKIIENSKEILKMFTLAPDVSHRMAGDNASKFKSKLIGWTQLAKSEFMIQLAKLQCLKLNWQKYNRFMSF